MVVWIILALPSQPGSSGAYEQVLRDATVARRCLTLHGEVLVDACFLPMHR
jgi:hypothetical protein